MKKIKWCLNQKKGIELIEPNENLSKQYFKEATETLQEISGSGSKWEVIMAYYACYHALYGILMKVGIKCEIHDCTIELMKILDQFTENDYLFLTALKEQRIRAQYYLKQEKLKDLVAVKKFILNCREIAENINIAVIRQRVKDGEK